MISLFQKQQPNQNHSPLNVHNVPHHHHDPYSSSNSIPAGSELNPLLATTDDTDLNNALLSRPFYLNTDHLLSSLNANQEQNSNRIGGLVSRLNDRLGGWFTNFG